MKYLLTFLFTFLIFNLPTASASSGKFVGNVTHVDDSQADQKLSPFLGLQVSEDCPYLQGLSLVGLLGVGYLDHADGVDAGKNYARLALDAYYMLSDWKLGFGGGLESDKDVYRSFGDYAHVSAEYKLW